MIVQLSHLQYHFRQAYINIASAKLRSFLAMLGILVGTASVVALISSGQLATAKALAEFKNLGSDLLSVALYEQGGGSENTPANTLTLEQTQRMANSIEGITRLAPYTTLYQNIFFANQRLNGAIIAAEQNLQGAVDIKVAEGRFISFLDEYEQYCVIGHDLGQQMLRLAPNSPLLGQQIALETFYCTVIGVLKPWPQNAFFNEDVNNAAIVPIRSATIIDQNAKIRYLVAQLANNANIDQVIAGVKRFIAENTPDLESFTRDSKQIINSMKNQGQIFTLLLGMIGGISLLVGGIGVMNVMLVSVAERKREIGIRKAIGATQRNIMQLFLAESVVLALLGGVIGVTLGILISYIIASFSGWGFQIFLLPPTIGFTVSAFTGIFFGFYPAYRASKLDPIQTLRYE